MNGKLLTIVPEIKPILVRLKRELLDPVIVIQNTTTTSETQTATPEPPRSNDVRGLLPNTTNSIPDVLRIEPR